MKIRIRGMKCFVIVISLFLELYLFPTNKGTKLTPAVDQLFYPYFECPNCCGVYVHISSLFRRIVPRTSI